MLVHLTAILLRFGPIYVIMLTGFSNLVNHIINWIIKWFTSYVNYLTT